MPKVLPIQNHFTAGILSPRMHTRTDVEGYTSGVYDSENMIPLKQGPMKKRPGTKYLQTLTGSVHRVFPIQMFADNMIGEAFCVLIDENDVSVIGATGLTSGKEIATNPSFSTGLSPWQVNTTGSAAVFWESTGVVMKSGQTDPAQAQYCEVTQQMSITSGKENDDHLASFDVSSVGDRGLVPLELRVGTTESGDDLYSDNRDGTFNPGGATSVWVTFRAYSNSEDLPSGPGEPGADLPDRLILNSVSVTETGSTDITFPHTWTNDEIRKLRVAQNPELETVYFTTGDSVPRYLSYTPSTDSWAFGAVAFTSQPVEWSDANGWPSVLTFYQGRSWWSGHKDHPNRIWSSKSRTAPDDYFDMGVGTAQDDEAIDTQISKRGKIVWMEPLGNTMVIGTTDAEFAMVSETGVVTPSDISFEEQSNNGSNISQPIKAGNFVLYASADGRKLYNIIYRWTENAWRSRDMTFTAEHLTVGSTISRIAYTKNPENVVWLVTSSSELLGCTFDPSTELVGWHKHDLGGDIIDLMVIDTKGTAKMFVVVQRTIDNTVNYYLEYLDLASNVYVDSYVEFSDTLNIDAPHLKNETVKIVADSYTVPDATLDSVGQATLDLDVTPGEMQVGLGYSGKVETLTPEFGYPSGSMLTLQKRWNRVYAYLTDSALPLIQGTRPADRSFQSFMDTPEPLTSGMVYVTSVGFSREGRIIIEADLPLPFTINAILGELNASNV